MEDIIIKGIPDYVKMLKNDIFKCKGIFYLCVGDFVYFDRCNYDLEEDSFKIYCCVGIARKKQYIDFYSKYGVGVVEYIDLYNRIVIVKEYGQQVDGIVEYVKIKDIVFMQVRDIEEYKRR